MSFSLYLDLQLAISSVIFFMGVSFMLDTIPQKLRNSVYDTSRKFIGVAYIVYALATFVYCFTDFRYKPSYYGVALNLSAYYTILMMLRHTFVPLLGRGLDYTSPSFVRDIIYCFLFPVPVWTAIFYGDVVWINYLVIATNVGFVLALLHQFAVFYKLYREAVGRANNYYSGDVEVRIGWMSTALKLVVSLGIVGCCAAFIVPISLTAGYLFMGYCLVIFIYVFKRFHHFMFTFDVAESPVVVVEKVEEECSDAKVVVETAADENIQVEIIPSKYDELDSKKFISSETYYLLQKNVNEWIQCEGFTQKEITIVVVASKVYSNRTYLSNYINTTYNCSFKSWITRLRIQKAKEIFLEDPTISVADAASRVGCSSPNSFNHLFKQSEGVSPAKWRSCQPQE